MPNVQNSSLKRNSPLFHNISSYSNHNKSLDEEKNTIFSSPKLGNGYSLKEELNPDVGGTSWSSEEIDVRLKNGNKEETSCNSDNVKPRPQIDSFKTEKDVNVILNPINYQKESPSSLDLTLRHNEQLSMYRTIPRLLKREMGQHLGLARFWDQQPSTSTQIQPSTQITNWKSELPPRTEAPRPNVLRDPRPETSETQCSPMSKQSIVSSNSISSVGSYPSASIYSERISDTKVKIIQNNSAI